MTISSSATPKAGPFIGNGVTTSFPFAFKVFAKSEVKVTLAVLATGAESVLVLDSDYTITLNPDQNTNPGGSVTYNPSGTPMASTHSLTLTSNVLETQGTDITNGGGFYPEVIEDALDRAVILVKQLREVISRSLTIPVSSTASTVMPSPQASAFIGWNASATALINYAGTTSTPVSVFMATVLDDATASAALTTLGVSAFAQTVLDDADAATARTTLGAVAKSGDTMTGVLVLPDGTAAAPALKVGGEQNGLHSPAANQLGIAAGGVNVATATTGGVDLTGTPTAPTASLSTNTTQIATTAFVMGQVANQADQEAASDVGKFVTPGRQVFSPSANKAHVNFNGTGVVAIRRGFNVTSITDNAAGDWTINFTSAFSGTDYSAEFGGGITSGSGQPCFQIVSQSTTACNIQCVARGSGALEDDAIVCANFQGDR